MAADQFSYGNVMLQLASFGLSLALVRVVYTLSMGAGITDLPVVQSTVVSMGRSVGDWFTQGTENVTLDRVVTSLIFSYFGYHVMAWVSILPVLACWFSRQL